jgi:hypothetical protein
MAMTHIDAPFGVIRTLTRNSRWIYSEGFAVVVVKALKR